MSSSQILMKTNFNNIESNQENRAVLKKHNKSNVIEYGDTIENRNIEKEKRKSLQTLIENCLKIKHRCFELIDKIIPTTELVEEAFLLACEAQHSVYDACYLVCARRHNSALLTTDQKLKSIAERFSIPNA